MQYCATIRARTFASILQGPSPMPAMARYSMTKCSAVGTDSSNDSWCRTTASKWISLADVRVSWAENTKSESVGGVASSNFLRNISVSDG